MRYRVKGEKPEKPEKNEKTAEKEEKPKKEKNLVYVNPMDFKEKRQFRNKAEEFFKGDWRKPQPSTYVTLETVIPSLPKAIAQPDEATFLKRQVELDEKIQALKKGIEDKQSKF